MPLTSCTHRSIIILAFGFCRRPGVRIATLPSISRTHLNDPSGYIRSSSHAALFRIVVAHLKVTLEPNSFFRLVAAISSVTVLSLDRHSEMAKNAAGLGMLSGITRR